MTARTQRGPPSVSPVIVVAMLLLAGAVSGQASPIRRPYNGVYAGHHLDRVAFPIGGIGAGMICLEGTGCISHVSVRNAMQVFHEPYTYAALGVKGRDGFTAKVLEGPVPGWKTFGSPRSGNGAGDKTYGLPRFESAAFLARFPFATVTLADEEIPLEVEVVGWSPFVPGHADDSSLPVGALEYRFKNPTPRKVEAVFSFNSKNFMATGRSSGTILPIESGFVLYQAPSERSPEHEGAFAVFTDDERTVVDHCWFKGGWWDAVTLAWRNIASGRLVENPPQEGHSPGASLFVPFEVAPGEEHVVRLMLAWYVPQTDLRFGSDDPAASVGPAFGYGPSRGTAAGQQEVSGFLGQGLVNTFDPRGDGLTGTLTSPEFTIDAPWLQFLIGGGEHPETACLELRVAGEVVCSATGRNLEQLAWRSWDVSRFRGRKAQLRIVDQERGAWGHVNVDQIILSKQRFESAADYLRRRTEGAVTVLQDFEGPGFGAWTADGPPAPEEEGPARRFHRPWYAGHFDSLASVVACCRADYARLRQHSATFRDAFYDSTLPPEVLEAVAAT